MRNLTSTMKQVSSENPFYNQPLLLDLYQKVQAGNISKSAFDSLLNSVYRSVSTSKQLKELFYTILFSAGDIANRQHNGIAKNADQGGNSNRQTFQYALEWIRKNQPSQYLKFVQSDAVRQYTTLDNILGVRVKTKPGTKSVTENINFLDGVDLDVIADYLASIVNNGSVMDQQLLAKFLSNVRLSARQKKDRTTRENTGSRALQDITKKNMKLREKLYVLLSNKLNWPMTKYPSYVSFDGMKQWKTKFNTDLESVVFSSGSVVNMDETNFKTWLDRLPSGARYRVRRRLLDGNNGLKGKWISKLSGQDLGIWFLEWEKSKEKLQAEERQLTEKVRQGTASEEDKAKLKEVAKAAKVNAGGTNLFAELEALMKVGSNKRELDLKIHSILKQIRFEVPVLTIADCSGSMGGLPVFIARLLTTLTMLKNPSTELDNLLVVFGSNCEIYTDGATGMSKQNRFVQGVAKKVDKLVDRTKSFSDNFNSISNFVNSAMGGTEFSSVARKFEQWIESDKDLKETRIEQLKQYPVFVVVSDGDMNNSYSAGASMMEFRSMLSRYGWDGVVVIWDVATGKSDASKFANIPNTMHFMGWNAAIVNQVFTKLDDLEVIDVYTPLLKLYESNRYDMVKANVI